ncbi:MAG: hypothetical protein E7Z86_10630 [Methanosphaera stadtmanae]|nr:hypothetical protein [Cellulosilyticum sp.]MBE6489153.1 hypothetical protein [Methanosphaera stadtmanae]
MVEQKREALTIMLFKETVKKYEDCLKKDSEERLVQRYRINPQIGLEGEIIVERPKGHFPTWKSFLQTFSDSPINLNMNSNNRAVMLVRVESRLFAVIFGYGKSLLNLDKIETNFGFKTALNLVDFDKIRSVNYAQIDSMIMSTQHQTPYYMHGGDFGIENANDIITSITGKVSNNELAQMVDGRDSLRISAEMEPTELGEKMKEIYSAYKSCRYKEINPWIDNIKNITDKAIIEQLDDELIGKILSKDFDNFVVAPPNIIDWGNIRGFMITGFGKRNDIENYKEEIDIDEYFGSLQNINSSLLRSRYLMAATMNDETERICSLYRALVVELDCNNSKYILFDGKWYQLDKTFYEKVMNYIDSIEISNITLPDFVGCVSEGEYNEMVANQYEEYALMDKKLGRVLNGPKQIEPCDLLTIDKKFLHVKKETKSSMLSHLFSQGKVAAIAFSEDEEFRRCVYESASQKFENLNENDFIKEPQPNEIEIIYVIITSKQIENKGIRILPFFSLVNLMLVHKELKRMRVRCSVKFVNA